MGVSDGSCLFLQVTSCKHLTFSNYLLFGPAWRRAPRYSLHLYNCERFVAPHHGFSHIVLRIVCILLCSYARCEAIERPWLKNKWTLVRLVRA